MSEKFSLIKPYVFESPDSEYIRNNVFWAASLSDGRTAYQNDDHPDCCGFSWLALKKYIEENNLRITGLSLRFRDHHEHLPADKDGYFFIKSITGNLTGWMQRFYKVGYLEGGEIRTIRYSVPELIAFEKESFPVDDEIEICLIRNKYG